MRSSKEPFPWYAGPFILLLFAGGVVGLTIAMRDAATPQFVFGFGIGYFIFIWFGMKKLYVAWKHTDNKFLQRLAKIAKYAMIAVEVVFIAGIIWFGLTKSDDIAKAISPVFRQVVTALLPKE